MNLAQAVYLQNNMEKGENSYFPEGISCSCILNVSVHHKENCLIDSLRPYSTVQSEEILQKRIFHLFT